MCYVHYITIATHSEAGGEVNEYASQGRAQSIARVVTSGETAAGRSVERKHGDGVGAAGLACKNCAIFFADFCQHLEAAGDLENTRGRKRTFKTVYTYIYNIVCIVFGTESNARRFLCISNRRKI